MSLEEVLARLPLCNELGLCFHAVTRWSGVRSVRREGGRTLPRIVHATHLIRSLTAFLRWFKCEKSHAHQHDDHTSHTSSNIQQPHSSAHTLRAHTHARTHAYLGKDDVNVPTVHAGAIQRMLGISGVAVIKELNERVATRLASVEVAGHVHVANLSIGAEHFAKLIRAADNIQATTQAK